ncbi:MAG TPA: APC family permease, partial [Povalibacter sp.]
RGLNHPFAANLIAGAAVLALPTVIMAFMYGQSRIFFVMARDGLLPQRLSKINQRTGSPTFMTLITGVIVAVISGFLPLSEIASVANAGTLCAFIAVALCMMTMRLTAPQLPRPFTAPLPWVIGPLAIVGCIYLFTSLSRITIIFFFGWNIVGILIYLLFSRHTSVLARE